MPVRLHLRRAAAVAALALLAGCTGIGEAVEGIGNIAEDVRGAVAPDRAEAARVGLLGTVTDTSTGGLTVNGLTVATTPETLLSGGFGPAGPLEGAEIPPGHVVEVAAERDGGGQLHARMIEPVFALAGPVEAVDADARRLVVLGAEVRVLPDTLLPSGGFRALAPGRRIAISGLWHGEVLMATRIDPQVQKGVADEVVSGVVSPLPGARYRIGGVPLAAELGTLHPGLFHVIAGEWVSGALVVESVRLGHGVIGRLPAATLVVEGFGAARDFAGFHSGYPGPDREGYFRGYSFAGREGKLGGEPAWRDHWVEIGGLGRPLEGHEREVAALDGRRALFVGQHEGPFTGEDQPYYTGDYEDRFDGEFDVEYIIPLPADPADRRAHMARIVDPLAPAASVMMLD